LKEDKREMVYEALRFKEPTLLPYHIDVLAPVAEKLKTHFATDDIDAAMGNFLRWLSMEKQWQELPGGPGRLPIPAEGGQAARSPRRHARMGGRALDEFAVIWRTTGVNRGYVVEHPLKEPSLKGYEFPQFDYEKKLGYFPFAVERGKGHFLVAWVGDLWERAHFLRGLDHLLSDLLLHPAFVHELLQRLEEIILRNMDAMSRYAVDAFFLSDDYGLQENLMMRPATWREFIKPHLVNIFRKGHQLGRICFLHSCGNVSEIVPDLIEVGLDVLHPIQPEAMDIAGLKKEYGSDLTFYGGLGTQQVLVRGSPGEVREEVKRLAEVMGQGGGYILGPGISIQHDVPLGNLLALIEEASLLAK